MYYLHNPLTLPITINCNGSLVNCLLYQFYTTHTCLGLIIASINFLVVITRAQLRRFPLNIQKGILTTSRLTYFVKPLSPTSAAIIVLASHRLFAGPLL